ncbi:MAG: hypothetical protein PHP13_07645 [Methanomicrobium sp.]|nr:hypothetical protein [Methanomicrobium sp.]
MDNRAKQERENIRRFKKRLNLTIKPENYEHIKNNGLNVSRFVDNAINELRTKTNKELVFILQKNDNSWAC